MQPSVIQPDAALVRAPHIVRLLVCTPDRLTLATRQINTGVSMDVLERQSSLNNFRPDPAFVTMRAIGSPCRLTLELLSPGCSGLCMWRDETEHGTNQDRSADNHTGTASSIVSESRP